ncbi:MAG: hypothetical protein GY719_35990 [bacterium]|nr:hypothetical protein [bacterium]
MNKRLGCRLAIGCALFLAAASSITSCVVLSLRQEAAQERSEDSEPRVPEAPQTEL